MTGKIADETIAGLNRNTTQHDKLENLFTDEKKEQIKNGFEIVKTFGQQASTFLQYKASDVENAKKNAESLGKTLLTGPDGQPVINQLTGQVVYVSDMSQPDYAAFLAANPGVQTLYSQYVDAQKTYLNLEQTWGTHGVGSLVLTGLVGSASGNVTGSASEMLTNAAINVVRGYTATEIKHIADAFKNPDDSTNATSETIRGLLHAVAGCAGAAATGGDCTSAAAGSAASVALNSLLNLGTKEMTEQDKQQYSNLIGSLVGGVTAAVGGDAAAAQLASKVEVDNNYLSQADVTRYAETMNACKTQQGEDRDNCIKGAFALAWSAHLRNEKKLNAACTGPGASVSACDEQNRLAKDGSRALAAQGSNLMIQFSAPSALNEMKTWQLHASQAAFTLSESERLKQKAAVVKAKINQHAAEAKQTNSKRTVKDNVKSFTG